jgi:integration host factor subunit alpha
LIRKNSAFSGAIHWDEAMAGKTVTRADLCEAVYQTVGLSRTESADLVELVLDEITGSIVRGEAVKLSSFGSFVVRKKGERVGRNPKTGEEVPISPRRVMVFKPSNVLKQRINELMLNGHGDGDDAEADSINGTGAPPAVDGNAA